MKIAIISDIHSNINALTAVMNDLSSRSVNAIICLGDIVGYNNNPNEVIELLKKHSVESVMGNHDETLIEMDYENYMNPRAVNAIKKNRSMLRKEHLEFLSKLPKSIVKYNCRFVHGVPPDNNWDYLFYLFPDDVRQLFQQFNESICFVGHSHQFLYYEMQADGALKIHESLLNKLELKNNARYIINCGSVGEPRGIETGPGYVIYDMELRTIEPVRLERCF